MGAGKISKVLFEQYLQKYEIVLSSNYGSTETGGAVIRVNDMNYESIGKTMEGVEIKICDEYGKDVERGEIGNIYVKSFAMFEGYYGDNSNQFDKDGYFDMGISEK